MTTHKLTPTSHLLQKYSCLTLTFFTQCHKSNNPFPTSCMTTFMLTLESRCIPIVWGDVLVLPIVRVQPCILTQNSDALGQYLASSCTMLTHFTVGSIQQDFTSYSTIAYILSKYALFNCQIISQVTSSRLPWARPARTTRWTVPRRLFKLWSSSLKRSENCKERNRSTGRLESSTHSKNLQRGEDF